MSACESALAPMSSSSLTSGYSLQRSRGRGAEEVVGCESAKVTRRGRTIRQQRAARPIRARGVVMRRRGGGAFASTRISSIKLIQTASPVLQEYPDILDKVYAPRCCSVRSDHSCIDRRCATLVRQPNEACLSEARMSLMHTLLFLL